ncbi:acyl-CoA dehydrogenase family protein [Acidiferrimicrobium sp. IK]|uniref:acyl-CoA dehydrogenase family protein n=1 Tax=Acidiferrimicrobium sp. IK TaxID=2871700 RepID=UPI0021CB4747|nr:acyl-CoA dehydrogenase family protein [Acidiferrimicrobium sp. IK]MCU4183574.1 acyl-CoA dehydrogenase family protein [Acidiferrimicrobium sp. IK]
MNSPDGAYPKGAAAGRLAVVGDAERLAEEVLWPAALEIDQAPAVPRAVLDQLAAAGLYGIVGPTDAGGSDMDLEAAGRVIEALGGASLATAFVWIQHHSALRAVAAARPALRLQWLEAMCAGEVRSGIAYAALRRPGPPAMRASSTGRPGFVILDGTAPWVTGWGLIDTVYVGAREGDELVWALLDARTAPTLLAEPVRLAAVDSSSTVVLRLERHQVPTERIVAREPYADWRARDGAGLATNGFLAVGVAGRCARLLESEPLLAAVDEARRGLVEPSGPEGVVAARVEASLLALRAATALVVAGGGRSVERTSHAQRLLREAMFLLVFGQTGPIRAAQAARLSAAAPGRAG